MTRRRALWLLGIAACAVGIVGLALDRALWDEGGPGIVGFELAWTAERAHEILVEWDESGRDAARWALRADFTYLALYGAFWFLAARAARDIARREGWRRLAELGGPAAWIAPAAALCDAVENVFLLLVIDGGATSELPPRAAALFAGVKFALLAGVLAYVGVIVARNLYRLWPRLVVRALVAAALLGVVFVALNTWLVERATGPARADVGRIVELPQGDVHVREDGDRSKPAVVLVHGYGCSLHWWDAVTPALARELRVVRLDLLGHGGSEKPRDGYSMENQADLVAALIERLGLRKPALIGHSMGGIVATALAERHPGAVSKVMTIGTPTDGEDQDVPITARAVGWPVTGHLADTFMRDWLVRNAVEQGFNPRFDVPERLIDDLFGRTTFSSFQGSADGIRDYWDERPLHERWRAIDVPLTAVVGERERHAARSVRRFNSVPGARTVVLQGLDHTPHVEAPERAADLLLAFALE